MKYASVNQRTLNKSHASITLLNIFVCVCARRKVTKLPPGLQASVMREVKLARAMGFIAGETLLHKSHLRRVREADARMQVHQQEGSN